MPGLPSTPKDWRCLVRDAGIRPGQGRSTVNALIELIDWADTNGRHGQTFASVERIAEETGACERTVRNHLEKLEEMGVVERVGRHNRAIVRRLRYDRLIELASRRNPDKFASDNRQELPEITGKNCQSNVASFTGDNRQVFPSKPASFTDCPLRPVNYPTPPNPPEGERAAGAGLLTQFKVGKKRADELARRHPPWVIFGVCRDVVNRQGVRDRGALIVSILQSDDAEDVARRNPSPDYPVPDEEAA